MAKGGHAWRNRGMCWGHAYKGVCMAGGVNGRGGGVHGKRGVCHGGMCGGGGHVCRRASH